eukprot:UN14388
MICSLIFWYSFFAAVIVSVFFSSSLSLSNPNLSLRF